MQFATLFTQSWSRADEKSPLRDSGPMMKLDHGESRLVCPLFGSVTLQRALPPDYGSERFFAPGRGETGWQSMNQPPMAPPTPPEMRGVNPPLPPPGKPPLGNPPLPLPPSKPPKPPVVFVLVFDDGTASA